MSTALRPSSPDRVRSKSRWESLPRPPQLGPFREGAFTSERRDETSAAVLGMALGVAFTTCFLTGLLSHLWQEPRAWFWFPSRPAGLYRVTQGLHVLTGLMSIPLLVAKLWVVYPKLFEWPPIRSVLNLLERLALLPLIGGSLLLLFTGLGNINIYRPWPFGFRGGHYWAAWLTIGGLIVHIGATWTISRRVLFRRGDDGAETGSGPEHPPSDGDPGAAEPEPLPTGMNRRTFFATVFGSAGAIGVFTIGMSWKPLERLALLAPRRPSFGPQGIPINRTAAEAGVTRATGEDPGWRLTIDGPGARRPRRFSLAELRAMPQREATLPITCVEGWSANAHWKGVPVRDLLALVGAHDGAAATVMSFQKGNRLGSSDLNRDHAHDPDTLLALELNGQPLHIEHGFPLRLIAPNRPGVLQTKWIDRLMVR